MKPTRRMLIFALVLALSFPPNSAAAISEEKMALIEEYLEVSETERVIEESFRLSFQKVDQHMDPMADSGYDPSGLTIEELLDLEKILAEQGAMFDEMGQRALERLDVSEITREIMIPLLDENFDEGDLRELIAFSRSRAGRKLNDVQATMDLEIQLALRGSLRPAVEEAYAEMKKEREEEETRRFPWRKAMADLRSIATAIEYYSVDNEEYPLAITMSELAREISPTYILEVPIEDPWGGEYFYTVSPDRMNYRLVCGGEDRRIDDSSRAISPSIGEAPMVNHSLDADIIYQNGQFLAVPSEWMTD